MTTQHFDKPRQQQNNTIRQQGKTRQQHDKTTTRQDKTTTTNLGDVGAGGGE
jgi:hypothetical protein